MRRVVITGIGLLTSIGNNKKDTWAGSGDFVFKEPAGGAVAQVNHHADSLAINGPELFHGSGGVFLEQIHQILGNSIPDAGNPDFGSDGDRCSLGHGLRGLESGATLTVAFAPNRWLLCVLSLAWMSPGDGW